MLAKLTSRKSNNILFIEFTIRSVRFRESLGIKDSRNNRALVKQKLDEVNADIIQGKFDLRAHFPNSKNIEKFDQLNMPTTFATTPEFEAETLTEYPSFRDFTKTWMEENAITWRTSHRKNVASIVRGHLAPEFNRINIHQIKREHLLAFRANLGAITDKNGKRKLSNARINKIMSILRAIINEASIRFEFPTPFLNIKQLKNNKSDIHPFSLDEVFLILRSVRPDYHSYCITRFFTGMRTGEIDGLKWKYVDFERKLILVRETIVDGNQEEDAKTSSSIRDIQMNQMVFEALLKQYRATGQKSDYVFCNLKGDALAHRNVTKRIWHPLLKRLGLSPRKPYQSRHTAATLWLAAGEAPEWIAKQLGHANTQMLFTVYSRYVPNLTRQDGTALETLIANHKEG